MRELNQKCSLEGRGVAPVINNCPAHPHIENSKSIKLFFLPPNTTSTTHPMDHRVIRSLKAKYRNNLVQKMPEVSILKAMQMLASAWNAISTETIVNCFPKAGISTASQEPATADEDDSFKDLQNEIDALQNLRLDFVPEVANTAL